MPFRFDLVASDPETRARTGRLVTPHGVVPTPAFMPVGTHGAVRTLSPEELRGAGTSLLLGNTYHLFLRPGHEVVEGLGGLHRFMGWDGPILTDSGGFQIFSLASLRQVRDEGVEFRSHLDGSRHLLTPETAIEIQRALGSDVSMVLDECPAAGAGRDEIAAAILRSTRWAARCLAAFPRESRQEGRALFGIVQGGVHEDLRREHAQELAGMGFDGLAVGGVSVGEPPEEIHRIGALMGAILPGDRPRYMMGLGTPADLARLIGEGFDLFDCVLPTRNARNGTLFTSTGPLHIRNEAHTRDPRPIDEACGCFTCRRFSRAYLRHLFLSREILGHRLNSIHNVSFYQALMAQAREAIGRGRYGAFRQQTLARLRDDDSAREGGAE